jgi:Holliday junction resolvase
MKVVTQGKRRGGDPASAAYSPDTQNVLQTNNRFSRFPRPQAEIRAELIGSDECTAAGLTIRGRAPVLALCRQLIADGHDPGLPLEVWRGPVLCLRVRSIGEAAPVASRDARPWVRTPPWMRGCMHSGLARGGNPSTLMPHSRQAKTHQRGCCAMSGARHHHKGIRIEREILSCHQALGIHAARHSLSGASRFRGGGHDVDIYLFGRDEAPAVAEVKGRKKGKGFATLERWLAEYAALFLRRNYADPLVRLPWRIWARILEHRRLSQIDRKRPKQHLKSQDLHHRRPSDWAIPYNDGIRS